MGESSRGIGDSVHRREDVERLVGAAEYTDDISEPEMAYAAIYRSRQAHARIERIDASGAAAMPGVLGVFTADDLANSGIPGVLPVKDPPYATVPDRPLLATGAVRFKGEPVAVVVADDRYVAHEARDRVHVEYEPLDAVTDPREALGEDAPTIHAEAPGNRGLEWELGDEAATDEAFDGAAKTVDLELVNNRVIPAAMEPRAVIASFRQPTGELTVEMATQHVHRHQRGLAQTLGLSEQKVRVRAPHVGGGFGSKMQHYPAEALTAWCAMQVGRPVKWQATRTEGFTGTIHGRGHVTRGELAVDADGSILGLRVETCAELGGYVSTAGALIPTEVYGRLLCGQYDVPAFHLRVTGAFTNTVPIDAYRGAGRPEACYVIERLVATAARECGLSPVEFRRLNFVPSEEFPHEMPTGHVYDSGDYEASLSAALDLADYEELRARRAASSDADRLFGIGLSSYVESSGSAPGRFESALVRFRPSGQVTVRVGTTDQGQGHRTSFAQVAADTLGIPQRDVEIVEGDTALVPEGGGTSGSRSAPVGGGAIATSAEKVIGRARQFAAHHFDTAVENVAFADGEFFLTGKSERSVHIQRVAEMAYEHGERPDGMEPGLEATSSYDPENYTFTFGTHVAAVAVDPEDGTIEIERYVAVDDAGRRINPMIVEGQVHGGVVQGIGQALYEAAVYDDDGELKTGSLRDYAIPRATHLPEIETGATETPSPHNPLGVKGVGEAGAIAAPAAIVNGVVDALRPLGIEHVDMPLTSESLWRRIQEADERS